MPKNRWIFRADFFVVESNWPLTLMQSIWSSQIKSWQVFFHFFSFLDTFSLYQLSSMNSNQFFLLWGEFSWMKFMLINMGHFNWFFWWKMESFCRENLWIFPDLWVEDRGESLRWKFIRKFSKKLKISRNSIQKLPWSNRQIKKLN